ncbi:MAG TPA: hypothetical protein VK466_15840, partial [Terriglobales bacterium]|nr:hypothetical protein [Terriglobales bacterium]
TELIDKAASLVADDKPGPRPAPLSERIVEARAAATVTVLKNFHLKVGEAIDRVTKVTGLEADRLRYFRDEIHRGRADETVRKIYNAHVKDLSRIADWTEMSDEERVAYALEVCEKYYSPGRPFRRHFDL